MKHLSIGICLLVVSNSTLAATVCTAETTIEELWVREGGWVHVMAEGISNMDISNCGINNRYGMILNFNDSSGAAEGKKMIYSALLTAFTAGKKLSLCSLGCDSQHTTHSRASFIDKLRSGN